MKATNTPIGDRTAHLAGRPVSHGYADADLLCCDAFAGDLVHCATNRGMLDDDAMQLQTVAGRIGPLFAPNEEIADGLTLVQRAFARLDQREQWLVELLVRSSDYPLLNSFRRAINWLGNGWLYLFATVAVLIWQGKSGIRPVLAAACAAGCAVVFYTSLKPLLGRLRPRDADPLLRLPIEPMDKYSCPSGHCMSATAIAVPLLASFPQFQAAILSLGILIAWSRLACGHHYLSDVLLGIGLGVLVSMPICGLIL